MYWVTSNIITLIQVNVLKMPGIRALLKIQQVAKPGEIVDPYKKIGLMKAAKYVAGERYGKLVKGTLGSKKTVLVK